uniref:RNase H type-1 domain-containing protein n=1 Tax=Chenopodium quinoa TaxID=63459 RepID=A0A803LUX6_CHEQI
MKDLGNLKYFLGIEVLRSKKGIFISQRKYVLDLLTETGMLNYKPADTPMVMNHGLQIIEGKKMVDQTRYQRLVGKILYLSHTRPDLAYAAGVVSRFMHKPQEQHLEVVYKILRYLKGSPRKGVIFRNHGHLNLHAFTDADWGGDRDSRKSTSGYFTLVGGNLVTWKNKRQKVVSMSSAEAEFRGIAKGVTEVLWLRKLLSELGYTPKKSCKLYCDNMASIWISENPVQHDRTKHVEIDRHFIKDNLEEKVISLPFVRSEDQLADILTKAVTTHAFEGALSKLARTSAEAEVLAIREGLLLALKYTPPKLEIETEADAVRELLMNVEDNLSHEFGVVIVDVANLIDCPWICELKHAGRKANKVAHGQNW